MYIMYIEWSDFYKCNHGNGDNLCIYCSKGHTERRYDLIIPETDRCSHARAEGQGNRSQRHEAAEHPIMS